MLHIVNKSPLERNALDACLRVAQGGASTAQSPCGTGCGSVVGRTTLRVPKIRKIGMPRYGNAAMPSTQASAA